MALDFGFHSPVEELHLPLLKEKNIRLSVKRDDMIHPFISGNKWRKLKYILKNAQEQQKQTLVTFGGAWSNHLLATACAGAKFGFETHGFVRGEEVQNPVLSLCKVFGMELHFVSREAYLDKPRLFEQHFDAKQVVFIDEGGYSSEAVQGCAEIMDELPQDYEHLFVGCGTGATVAGVSVGIAKHQKQTQLHGVPVLKGGDFIRHEISALGVDPAPIQLHTEYHFGGYAKTKPELLLFIQDFVSGTGILLEPTYTGKVFYAVFDLIRKGYFREGDHILILHTGGLTGFLGMYQKF